MTKSDDGWNDEMNDKEDEYYAKGPSSRNNRRERLQKTIEVEVAQAAARMKRGNQ